MNPSSNSAAAARLKQARGLQIGLAQFPGSNCDVDCLQVFKRFYGIDLQLVWHLDRLPEELDGLILPGGFSYGDYLRGGALASHSPVMEGLKNFVAHGKAVIGICNGFQILTESGLLPGVLLRNRSQKFVCREIHLKAQRGASGFHKALEGQVLKMPIAHGEGRFYLGDAEFATLKQQGQILFQYCSEGGDVSPEWNPNGAIDNVAGITDRSGKVLGMMPHPERACDLAVSGVEDGLLIWDSFVEALR